MRCPNCGGRGTGKIGNQHYFCRDCYVEFFLDEEQFLIFGLDDQGELIPAQYQSGGSLT